MNEPHDPNRTVDVPSAPADSLDAGLAAGFGPPRARTSFASSRVRTMISAIIARWSGLLRLLRGREGSSIRGVRLRVDQK